MRATGRWLAVYLLALVLRLLHWQATPDRDWGWSALFKGDAPLWLEWGQAARQGDRFELGLPLHPPGAAWLVAAVWDGSGPPWPARLLWCGLGALVAPLSYALARRDLGERAAWLAALLTAGAWPLIVLSTGLASEIPHLVLVLAGFLLWPPAPAPAWREGSGGAVHGLACLFRPEHLLAFVLLLGHRLLRQRRPGLAAVALLGFAAALGPWHLQAWSAIARFNREPLHLTPVEADTLARLEQVVAPARWEPEAAAALAELPAFARRHAALFVSATVLHRGALEVRAADLAVLDQAYGVRPRPLPCCPFVSLGGPLNLALANAPGAGGGFSRAALDRPPPLRGGPRRYPAALTAGLPPADLSLLYPPHLELLGDGHRLAARWALAEPAAALRRMVNKARLFLAGALAGLGGFNWPAGTHGTRPAVDLLIAEGIAATLWRWLGLGLAAAALLRTWRRPAVAPWRLYALARLLAALAFFGYARLGATVIPVLALVVAAWWAPPARVSIAALVLLAGLEAARAGLAPGVWIDGRPAGRVDPEASDLHRPHRVEIALRRE